MLRAAIELFAEQGYAQTTLAQVGKASGYTGGTVSHHFGSKEGLLHDVVAFILQTMHQRYIVPASGAPTGIAALEIHLDRFMHEIVERPAHLRALYVLMGESLGVLSGIAAIMRDVNETARRNVKRWIEKGIADGSIRAGADPATEASIYLACIRGLALQWIADPECFDVDAVTRSLRTAMGHALRRDRGAPDGPPGC